MPEMTLPEGIVRVALIEGVTVEVAKNDRYMLVEVNCKDEVTTTSYSRYPTMLKRYANRLRHMVTHEPVSGVGHDASHLTKVFCLVFKADGSGMFSHAPIVFPQADQVRDGDFCGTAHAAA